MSIADELRALEANGEIVRYRPERARRARRRLYLARRAVEAYNDPHSAVSMLVGKGYVCAALDRWALGDRVCGDATRCRFLCPLHPPPPHIWEVRVTLPVAQGRLFGCFLEPNTLVLTHFHMRRYLDEDDHWFVAMTDCQRTWERLFPFRTPFQSTCIPHYVTENCDDFPIVTRPPRGRRGR